MHIMVLSRTWGYSLTTRMVFLAMHLLILGHGFIFQSGLSRITETQSIIEMNAGTSPHCTRMSGIFLLSVTIPIAQFSLSSNSPKCPSKILSLGLSSRFQENFRLLWEQRTCKITLLWKYLVHIYPA